MVSYQSRVVYRILSRKMILTVIHLKISAVKHRPGGRNDTPSPKPRRSDASESGKNWLLNMHLCAYQKGLQTKTCRQNPVCLAFCYTTTQTSDLESAALVSLFSSVSSVHSKDEGRCMQWVCVWLCIFTHHGFLLVGHMGVSRALKDSTALCYRRGEGGQRVNGRFCTAAPSVSETESAVLFRLPMFFCPSHLFVLTSTVFLPLTPVLAPVSCWMWKKYASRCLI